MFKHRAIFIGFNALAKYLSLVVTFLNINLPTFITIYLRIDNYPRLCAFTLFQNLYLWILLCDHPFEIYYEFGVLNAAF